jgi:hypothetical protein
VQDRRGASDTEEHLAAEDDFAVAQQRHGSRDPCHDHTGERDPEAAGDAPGSINQQHRDRGRDRSRYLEAEVTIGIARRNSRRGAALARPPRRCVR